MFKFEIGDKVTDPIAKEAAHVVSRTVEGGENVYAIRLDSGKPEGPVRWVSEEQLSGKKKKDKVEGVEPDGPKEQK